MKMFMCIKNLTVVHHYQGGVLYYHVGDEVAEITLIRNGLNPKSQYFKEI